MSGVRVQVDNLPALIRRLRENAGAGKALEQGFEAIGLHAMSASRRRAPVDVGLLRNRISYEVDRSPLPTFVRIGTLGGDNPGYAAYMEYGTGTRHDHPSWPRKPHRLNPAVLEGWVARKGRSRGEKAAARRERLARVSDDARAAAYGIMRRGGLEPRRYLRGPFEGNQVRYVRTLAQALRKMTL